MADPYAVSARLREAGPVHRIAGTDGLPAWLVTRYADVRQALAAQKSASVGSSSRATESCAYAAT